MQKQSAARKIPVRRRDRAGAWRLAAASDEIPFEVVVAPTRQCCTREEENQSSQKSQAPIASSALGADFTEFPVRQAKPGRGGSNDVANQSRNLAEEPSGFNLRPAKVGHQPETSLARS
ncbi:hypothetical protein [Sorangium sp. So ce542]|uniref:hypothetical protein n=1 Tax=Sorangium sp. So ce542 TaxID=3133316 RepID=UPI003F630BF2